MTVVANPAKTQKVQSGPSDLVTSVDRSSPPNVVQITRVIHWLLLISFALGGSIGLVALLLGNDQSPSPLSLFAALAAFFLWLVRKQNDYTPRAWKAQLIVFVIGLLAFPSGTIICGFILWAWFKPETRAWFGCS